MLYRLFTRNFCYNFLNNKNEYIKKIYPDHKLNYIQSSFLYSFRITNKEINRLLDYHPNNQSLVLNKVVLFNKLLRGGIPSDNIIKPLSRKELLDIVMYEF